jgi:hypothetical protein
MWRLRVRKLRCLTLGNYSGRRQMPAVFLDVSERPDFGPWNGRFYDVTRY